MAGGKMNYRVQAELNTKRFKAGANELRREFAALKSGFLGFTASLGASVGLFGILSRMKDVAVNLNVARATLKNASKDFIEYSNNLEFVDRLSKDYKQDLIVLTDSFAKFHAAAQGTNFSLEQQKKMYEGLVKAAAFYHMSAERTEDMLVAVEQMMSKGKITAEELRRQLGNNLPGAYAKMAKAAIQSGYAGIKSFADFEKAMKAGRVGVDLLAKFIDNLNEETKNIDLNSLQMQMNELKNSFTRFVESSNFEEFLKKAINVAKDLLDYLRINFKTVLHDLELLFGAIFGIKIVGFLGKAGKAVLAFSESIGKLYVRLRWMFRSWASFTGTIGKFFKSLGGGVWTVAIAGLVEMVRQLNKVTTSAKDAKDSIEKLRNIEYDGSGTLEERQAKAIENKKLAQQAIDEAEAYFNKKMGLPWDRRTPGELYGTWQKQLDDPLFRTGRGEIQAKIKEYDNNIIKLRQARWQLNEANKELELIAEEYNKLASGVTETTENDLSDAFGTDKDSDFVKAVKKYKKEQEELDNQLAEGTILLSKYNEETAKLTEKSWQAITAFNDFRKEIAGLDAELKPAVEKLEENWGNNGLRGAIVKITEASNDYYKEAVKQKAMYDAGYITEKEYNSALERASQSAIEAMQGINNLAAALQYLNPISQAIVANIIQTYETLHQEEIKRKQADFLSKANKALQTPDLASRWSYKESKPQFFERMSNAYEKQAEDLEKLIEEAMEDMSKVSIEKLKELQEGFEDASQKAKDFKDMADLSEWANEIKDLRKELAQGIFGGIKETATSMDRLVDGVKSFKETLEDSNASGWDKFIAGLNEVIQLMDTMVSLYETFNSLHETNQALKRAQSDEEMKMLSQQYFINGSLIQQKKEQMAINAAEATQASKNAAANLANQSALAGEAVAGATASGAKMPFPYNLIAIAAGVSAVLAALSSISRFAGGGVVSGSKHGDRNLAAVNGGEMILNQNQQGRLWGWLNGRGSTNNGSNNKVEFVISGSNLRGVLKNEERIRTGRS